MSFQMNATASPHPGAAESDRQVAVRLERQAILHRPEDTTHAQLLHLVKASELPHVCLQVLAFDAPTYATASYGFVILGFGSDSTQDVIYVEDYTDAVYLDRPDAVGAYTRLWSRLQTAALGPTESRHLITQIADQITRRA